MNNLKIKELSCTENIKYGKTFNKSIRKTGFIPSVIYNKNIAQSIIINHSEILSLLQLLDYKKDSIKLKINKQNKIDKNNYDTIVKIKKIQQHPFKRKILHIEFVAI